MTELQETLNLAAGTTGLDAQGAANVLAGTSGLDLVGALNVAAGNALGAYREIQGVIDQLDGSDVLQGNVSAIAVRAFIAETGVFLLTEAGNVLVRES